MALGSGRRQPAVSIWWLVCFQDLILDFFEHVDMNKDGFIDLDEFIAGNAVTEPEMREVRHVTGPRGSPTHGSPSEL